MLSFANRLRLGARRLGRAPLFTAVTLLTLAIGIGANTAIFSVIDGVLLKPLPYPQPERLATISHTALGLGIKKLDASPSLYFTYREENRTFEDVALWDDPSVTVTGLAEPERVDSLSTTFALFPLLRARPALGRTFNTQDDRPGSPETVILSYGYWQRRFGGDPTAVGRRLMADGRARDIIGVMPRDFRFLDLEPELFIPKQFDRAKLTLGNFSFNAMARLKPGVTFTQANADVARMLPMSMDKFPMPAGFTGRMFADARIAPNVIPLKDDVVGDVGSILWVLMGTVGIVLLIACANVANLFLVRAEGRQQELVVRAALGAGWGRLARELLAESIGLAILGGIMGLGLAYAGLRLLIYMAPANMPRLGDIVIDPLALLFTLAVSVIAGILFGLIPVFKYARANLGSALREGGRALSEGKARHRARNVLVVSQIAMALVLLVSAGLMMRTFRALRNVNPGFIRPAEVLTFRITIPDTPPVSPDQIARTHQQIVERILRIPGVAAAGTSSTCTMGGGGTEHDPIFVEQSPTPEGQIPPIRTFKFVTPGYLGTMGNPILAGREIAWNDIYGRLSVVQVSENFARQYWKTPVEALGKRIRNSPKSPWREIVGVVGNERDEGVDKKAPQIVYWPLVVDRMWDNETAVWRRQTYAVRSARAGTHALLKEIREVVRSVDASLPVTNVRTLQAVYERSMARTSFTLALLGIASAMALLLGLVGIYGVISYSVSQRTREIGIRMALGAEDREVRGMFVRHGFLLTAVGVAIGVGAAVALTRAMSTLLFDVSPVDPVTYAAVAAILVAAALLASYLPARRATAVDPARALRAE